MATNRPVWGIDLGQNALKAIRLRSAGDAVEAVDYAYIEHGKILSSQTDTAARAAMVAETMKKFLEGHNLSKELIVVAVPGQHTLARFTKLPPVDKKKVPEIVKYEAQQQIPFDMEEVIWDYQVFGHSAEGTEVGIFAMRREVLRDHLRFLSDLNLEPAAVQSAPLALYNALKFDGILGAESAVILDIGAQNSDLIICDGESLWTRNIPIGGNHFTEALLKTFKLSFNKAENLKRTAASSKYARQIFQAMRPVFADLVAEVQRSIGFFTGSHRGVKLSRLIAMGNAFQLPGMVKFIQQNLGMDVVRPTSFSKLSASEAPNAPDLLKQLGSFGVAYGLALQGLGKAQITSNLLPSDIAKQIVWRKKTPWFYGAAACLAMAAGVIWFRSMADSSAIAAARGGDAPVQVPNFPVTKEKWKDTEIPRLSPEVLAILGKDGSNQSPVMYAASFLGASRHVTEVVNGLISLNSKETAELSAVSQAQAFRIVFPMILDKVYSALPRNPLIDAMSGGPNQYREFLRQNADQYARPKREVIFIDKLTTVYYADVLSGYEHEVNKAASGGAGMAAPTGPASGAAKPAKVPGFVVTIDGYTPHANGCEFVDRQFIKELRRSASAREVSFDPDRIRLVNCHTIQEELGKGGTGDPGADLKDPLTRESKLGDYRFKIVCAVMVKVKAAEQAPAGQ